MRTTETTVDVQLHARALSRHRIVGCASLLAVLGTVGCDDMQRGREASGGGIDVPGYGSSGGMDEPAGSETGDMPDAPDDAPEPDHDDPPPPNEPEIPFDPGKLDEVCARGNGDRVAQALCGGTQLDSIADLRDALAFDAPFFSLTGNSSSLVARHVSAINPRIIIGDRLGVFEDDPLAGSTDDLLAMGFARGEQFVELVGFDPVADELNFYLLMFEQDCNDTPDGCDTADLVTPAIEENWTRWTLYQDVDLVNTTLDCNVCHQPLGPGTPKVPRVQEISNSWTHWFPTHPPDQGGGWSSGGNSSRGLQPEDSDNHGTRSSEVLWEMFERMHASDGSYGGVTLEELRPSAAGPDLETFVKTYLMTRELPEPLQVPLAEGEPMNSDYFADSPTMEILGHASGWQEEYERVASGQRLPLPSHRIDITHEYSREQAIQSYLDVTGGLQSPGALLDPRDVLAPDVLTQMSLLPREDASAQEILTHMCSRCHNGTLDQSLSRARFDATTLSDLTPGERAAIGDRITRDHGDKLQMPPPRFGRLPHWAVDRVLAWLEP